MHDSTQGLADLLAALDAYSRAYPAEATQAAQFAAFARSGADVSERTRLDGHLTASCWLVSADGERALLTHHRKLQRWLQLGGHADGDLDLARAALREALEESGLLDLQVESAIFDLDAHQIPARGAEPEHTHWDVRYVVRCGGSEDYAVSEESLDLAWLPIASLATDSALDPSIRRMAAKWLARC